MIIDGKLIAAQIQNEIKQELTKRPGRRPCLAVVLVGNHPASLLYVERKRKACAEVDILSVKNHLPLNTSEATLIEEIEKLNLDNTVDGILLQLPLPAHINPIKVIRHIAPHKDVDGLHPANIGKLLIGDKDTFAPCTPQGIKVMLERSGVEVAGKHALIIGRSNLVGKPMAAILMQSAPGGNATVTVAHSRTANLKALSLMADIIIAAIGQPLFVTADMIKDGAVVIDVGINKIEDKTRTAGYRIVGDVDFDNVKGKCSFISPVPGGVGPMTIAMLLSNTLHAYSSKDLNRT